MIKYTDYIDKESEGVPYSGFSDFLRDSFSFLDMFIEECRQVNDRVTADRYYSIPPCLRRIGGESASLSDEVTGLSTFMAGRQQLRKYPLTEITDRLNLTDYEYLAVLAALSVEYDERYCDIYSEILGYKTKYPTVGLINRLVRLMGDESISEQNSLVAKDSVMSTLFFDFDDEDGVPTPEKKLRLYTDMTSFLLGDEELNFYVRKLLTDHSLGRHFTQINGADIFEQTLGFIDKVRQVHGNETFVMLLRGDGSLAKQAIAELAAGNGLGRALVINLTFMGGLNGRDRKDYFHRLRFASLGTDVILLNGFTQESILAPSTGIFVNSLKENVKNTIILVDVPEDNDSIIKEIMRCPAFSDSETSQIPVLMLEDRIYLWMECLKECEFTDDVEFSQLGDGYELKYDDIINISADICRKTVYMGIPASRQLIRDCINDAGSASFGALASRLRTDFSWDDICIENSQKKILQMACDRYLHRNRVSSLTGMGRRGAYGNGVSVLLYGPPGTGKTMAAQIVANEVGLPLYRVDLSQLSSKYIGETQKNLSRVFDEAAKTNVILFFDEADSVFSKRTEVESSNDKYSNAESAFLLQKLEAYSGFVLLATNFFNNFDSAFVRRITYAVSLVSPDEATRIRIWKSVVPKSIVCDERIDYDLFGARFDLSGSNIKAIVTSAVYMSQIEGTGLTNRHIALSLFYEFRKLGKMFPVSDLGPYGTYISEANS